MYCKYFSLFFHLLFHFLNDVLSTEKSFKVRYITVRNFEKFVFFCLAPQILQNFLLEVLWLLIYFCSLICVIYLFIVEVRSIFFFQMEIQFFQYHCLKKIFLFLLNCFGTFVENQQTIYGWVHFGSLSFNKY